MTPWRFVCRDCQRAVASRLTETPIQLVERHNIECRKGGGLMTKDEDGYLYQRKEMPRYRCHKEVHAVKITVIGADYEGRVLETAEEDFPYVRISEDYVSKHNPQVGGYYVRYEDGYESYSPAAAFESGYHRI